MWKAFVPIVVGVAVGIATAILAFGIIFATTWSVIHRGRSEFPGGLEIALVYAAFLCAVAAPVALGSLAGWATRRALGKGTQP